MSDTKTALTESSLPIEGLQKQTKGLQPRSREASSRESMKRTTSYDIEHFKRRFMRNNIAKTYIDPEIIPEGLATLWARKFVTGMPDSTNIRELEANGWRFAEPSEFPSLSYLDDTKALTDDSGRVSNNEFYLMVRPKEIHDLQISIGQQKANKKMNFSKGVQSMGSDIHPMGQQGNVMGYNNVTTTSQSEKMSSQHFAS